MLLLLSILPSTASNQAGHDATSTTTAQAIQLALNPQPEPPNMPRTSDGTSGKKSKPKPMKQPKKGDPGH
ncbi:hypothetical protein XH89_06645 [Bradyrhizobium sp. CCBAU 53340]|nr:hypothetical protein XH89_06645 [Bradyrhizobium sp. CCBAU 53340]